MNLLPWLALSAALHAAPLAAWLLASPGALPPRAGSPHEVQVAGQAPATASPASMRNAPGPRAKAGDAAPVSGEAAPADAYLADARARIEARFPARLPQSVRDAIARAGHALRAELKVQAAADGVAAGVELSRSTGAPEVDALLLRLAREVERFLPPADGKPFQFLVPLELYEARLE